MNPNHPHYAGLGGGPNLNLLDNMLMAAGFQVIHFLFGFFFINILKCLGRIILEMNCSGFLIIKS